MKSLAKPNRQPLQHFALNPAPCRRDGGLRDERNTMQLLMTKEQAAEYLVLKTPDAVEKLLKRLGVPRIDFSLVGSNGIRYRRSDIDAALSKIEVNPNPQRKVTKKKKPTECIFDRPIKEQMAYFTSLHQESRQ